MSVWNFSPVSSPLKLSDKITIRKRENLRFLTRYVLIRVKVKTVKMFIGVFSTPTSLWNMPTHRIASRPSISTVTSVRFVFRSSFNWFIISILSFSLSLFLLSWRSYRFFGLTLKETDLLNQLRVNICKGNNINYLNFMDWKHSCKWKKQNKKQTNNKRNKEATSSTNQPYQVLLAIKQIQILF